MPGDINAAVNESQLALAEDYRRRKATAVLCPVFGDVEDSTHFLEQLGEIEYGKLRESLEDAILSVVQRDEEGVVLKTYGDGFLAVFSEPSTAVERSLEIQRMLEGQFFSLRIGVDMGQVALKKASGILADIFGRQVNRACRIQARAKPGSVLTSFPVYDSSVGWLRNTVRWSHQRPTRLKGFEDPISLHEPILVGEITLHTQFNGPDLSAMKTVSAPSEHTAMLRLSEQRDSVTSRSGSAASGWHGQFELATGPLEDALVMLRAVAGGRFRRMFSKKCIMWVDDYPENNRYLMERFSNAGLRIDTVSDTSPAIDALRKGRYEAIISDMGRASSATAGLDLITQLRDLSISMPVLVYTSPASAAEHGPAAVDHGALICTAGAVSLVEMLAKALEPR